MAAQGPHDGILSHRPCLASLSQAVTPPCHNADPGPASGPRVWPGASGLGLLEPLTSLAWRTAGTHHLPALRDGHAGRLAGARAGLADVGSAQEGVAIETWQAALTGRALGVVVALADP